MKPEDQRIAIAETLGAKWGSVGGRRYLSFKEFTHEWQLQHLPEPALDIPDFLNDLNACHGLEKALTKGQQRTYAGWLYLGRNCSFQDDCTNELIFAVLHKSPAQRCEAFLKTLNLWIDTE